MKKLKKLKKIIWNYLKWVVILILQFVKCKIYKFIHSIFRNSNKLVLILLDEFYITHWIKLYKK